ncbi:MAG TPA: GAF domain-containing protein, partial [Mycobacterium sp.]|nr:GAF domain-containing protein [Mycobacterium sp.]
MNDDESRALVEEQAALRRVATLVARGVSPGEVFAAVTEEIGELLPVEFAIMGRYEPDEAVVTVAAWNHSGNAWPPVGSRWPLDGKNLATVVYKTGRPARIDSYADASGPVGRGARAHDFRSTVGVPIVVEGRVWGAMTVGSTELELLLPPDVEAQLSSFTELVATAIANAESRNELTKLVEEQAALRRVATLVAHGAAPMQLFAAVTQEVGLLLGAHLAGLGRYGTDHTVTVLGTWAAEGQEHPLVPGPWPLEGGDLASRVLQTAGSVRIDTYDDIGGPIAAFVRDELRVGSSVAGPIAVEGELWGTLWLHAKLDQGPFPQDAEFRLTAFSELVASAIANTESRADVARLAEEQAALRRVATLVAGRTPPEELFAAVTEEIGSLFDVDWANMARYEPDNTVTFVATWSRTADRLPVGSRWTLGGHNLATLVFEKRHSARIDNFAEPQGPLEVTVSDAGIRSGVGSPIIVDGGLWGVIGAGAVLDQLPPDTEERLASFTELVAMAVANTESRAQLKMSRARIVTAADKARQQIERDLHDGTQQQLVSLMLELRAAEANQQADVGDMRKKLTRTAQALDGVLEELREISRGIHPAILSKAGLEPALKTLARRSALPVELDLRTDRRPPEHVEVA